MMPTATSGWPKRALPSAAYRMSRAIANSLPPPRAMPSMTAIVAFGMIRNSSTIEWNGVNSSCSEVSSRGSA
jgi:hypothetical protein